MVIEKKNIIISDETIKYSHEIAVQSYKTMLDSK